MINIIRYITDNPCNVESTIISQSFDYSLIGKLADVVLSFVPGPPTEIKLDI